VTYWALQLAYDGSRFAGFQALPQMRTVQGELEQALIRLLGKPMGTVAAGRTDAGVHAYGQVVSFQANLPFPLARLRPLLQKQLPPDIVVKAVWPVGADFHARFSARGRHYRYRIWMAPEPDPFAWAYAWHVPYPLDLDKLADAWGQLVGIHDFAAWGRSGGSQHTTVFSLWLATVRVEGPWLCLDLVAERFLYSMVRTLVGTGVDIARGRLPQNHLQQLLFTPDRAAVGVTAPPNGLYFCRALYDPRWGVTPDYPEPLSTLQDQQIPSAAWQDPGHWWTDPLGPIGTSPLE
jgi:tRNA pseudouridine38-40 synthase